MGAMADDTVALILAWHHAVNAGHTAEALALSSPDIRVGGPRGSAAGHAVFAEWIGSAGITLTPRVIHVGARAFYVEQDARWASNTDPGVAAIHTCTVFEVSDGLVAAVLRYDALPDALEAMGDEVSSTIWSAA